LSDSQEVPIWIYDSGVRQMGEYVVIFVPISIKSFIYWG